MTKDEAEKMIGVILCQLEKDSGSVVRSICARAIDITTIDSASAMYQMQVSIELERLPGHQW